MSFIKECRIGRFPDSPLSVHRPLLTDVPSKDEVRRALFTCLAANGMRDGVHVRLTLSRGLKTTSSMNPVFNIYGCCLLIVPEHKPVGGVATYVRAEGVGGL